MNLIVNTLNQAVGVINNEIASKKLYNEYNLRRSLGAAFAALFLAACGGGGADAPAAGSVAASASASAAASAAMISASSANAATNAATRPTLATGSADAASSVASVGPAAAASVQAHAAVAVPVTLGPILTDIRIRNTGTAQANVPFTFGQVIAAGQMSRGEGLAAKLDDGTVITLQVDVKATHGDGSVRHVVVSGVLPSLAAGQVRTLQLAKSGASAKSALTLDNLAASGLTSKVALKINNVQYSASLAEALAAPGAVAWLSGEVANEWIVSTPLRAADGSAHPLLVARFAVRWYSGLGKQARVDVIVENNKTFTAGAQNLTYDVNVEVGGRSIYSRTGLTHYHHSRWHQSAWWDASRVPAFELQHNTDYLIATKAVSNYDRSVVPDESTLEALGKKITANNTGPMTIGPVVSYMGTAGGRPDIGPLPSWSVLYLLSHDKRALDAMMAAADGAASWSIHYRDEKTGYPVRTDNDANKRLSTHMNLAHTGPLPVPRCAAGGSCSSPYSSDTSHQPSMVYLPYLLTGDYYYLEELQFWAAWNPLGTDPGNSGLGLGLVRWQQLRGQAWSLRTLGHAAYITPDGHPLKDYFTKQLDNNLDYYHRTFVTGNPNQLGVYDGTGEKAFRMNQSAPWQDDFFTWSFGYLAELGFSKATPILQWKAKFPVGRMTAPGYCWIEGSPYTLKFRDNDKSPAYNSMAEVYAANFGGAEIVNDDSKRISHPQGLKFIDQECASQAQADWLSAADGTRWVPGRMIGYAGSPLGYPANMQPALSVAATSGIPNAALAWSIFANRAAKPDYSKGPQWAIVPR
jgi:hypothetical protein